MIHPPTSQLVLWAAFAYPRIYSQTTCVQLCTLSADQDRGVMVALAAMHNPLPALNVFGIRSLGQLYTANHEFCSASKPRARNSEPVAKNNFM